MTLNVVRRGVQMGVAHAAHAVKQGDQVRCRHRPSEVHTLEVEVVGEGLLDAGTHQLQVFPGVDVGVGVNGYRPVDRLEEVDLNGDDLARFQERGQVSFQERRRRPSAVRSDGQVDLIVADVGTVLTSRTWAFATPG